MRVRKNLSSRAFLTIGVLYVGVAAAVCALPFVVMLINAFSSEQSIIKYGYSLIPREISLEAFATIFKSPVIILRAYGVTALVTVSGTVLGLLLMSMAAYVIYRKDFRYRNAFALMIYLTTMFSGGLIPFYILVTRYLQLKDNYLAMILPSLASGYYIILLKNFFKSIPDALVESAKIDGANDFYIYSRLILPLSTAGLATIGLFLALAYWNDWFLCMLFIERYQMYNLQYFLYKMLNDIEGMNRMASKSGVPLPRMPLESMKMALGVVVSGPIILLYPFLQRYFVKGITIGAVKG